MLDGDHRILGIAAAFISRKDEGQVRQRGIRKAADVRHAPLRRGSIPRPAAADIDLHRMAVAHIRRLHGRHIDIERRIRIGHLLPNLIDRGQFRIAERGCIIVLGISRNRARAVSLPRRDRIAREIQVERSRHAGRLLSAGSE